jgi:hypothetical protein
MPEFIHTFQRGRMNKDLDERLIPNGEYRDALNLDIANSDGSNVGTLQNVKGNVEIRHREGVQGGWQANYIDGLTNPVCIGSIRDDKNEKIYWFIASDDTSAIAEYDQTTGFIYPILVDKNNILNFSTNYLITGINILDKFLFWTDDQTEPKKINIEKFKTGSKHFNAHTKIPIWLPQTNTYQTNISGQPDFTEEDITVIKKSPLTAPQLNIAASKFGNDPVTGLPINGTGISPVTIIALTPAGDGTENFTYIPDVANNPAEYESLPTYGEFLENTTGPNGDPDYYEDSNLPPNWDGRVSFQVTPIYGNDENGNPVWQPGDLIVLQGTIEDDFNETYEYGITIKIFSLNNNNIVGEIQAISSDILKFEDGSGNINPVIWEAVLFEKKPMFEYVFPRFAYRWKYIDNEYSAFSPFSDVAFIGNEFKYVSSDGYNIGMTNNIRKLIIESLDWGSDEVAEIEILYKESNNTSVYSVDSIKKKDYLPSTNFPTTFKITTEIIGALIEPNQLLRPWDNVPRKAKAQEVVANRIIYGNYLQNYTVEKVNLRSSFLPYLHKSALNAQNDNNPYIRMPEGSLKSIRTYQAGIIFKDEYGRETPVITNEGASVQIPVENSDTVNKIEIVPGGTPPSWATHYKFFIKETANEYYNLALDRFYNAEDGNVWLSFPSSERNKVDEETYLILKKQHDNDVAVNELYRYKILSIQNSAPDFIATFEKTFASVDVTFTQSLGVGFKTLKFNANGPIAFQEGFKSGNYLRIQIGGLITDSYEIAGGGLLSTSGTSYDVDLALTLGLDAAFLDNKTPNFSARITLIEKVIERKPEFEGRFFVKINRDFAFDQNIISSFAALEPRYAITNSQIFVPQHTNPVTVGRPREFAWRDNPTNNILTSNRNSHWYYYGSLQNGGSLSGSDFFTGDTSMGNISLDCRVHGRIPALGNNFFGFSETPLREPNDNNNCIGYMATMYTNDFSSVDMAVGAFIRFKDPSGNRSEEPYRILGIAKKAGFRGALKLTGGGSNNCAAQRHIATNTRRISVYKLDREIDDEWIADANEIEIVEEIIGDNNKILTSSNPAIFETEPKEAVDLDIYNEASDALLISGYGNPIILNNYYNCYSYGNGVESNRIRDDYNAPIIDKGPKLSAPLDEPYAEERRGSGMIFSQIFNSLSGVNRLNQFIQAEAITKDLNPIYGTIQKLHSRDTDAIVLCEDKCLKILANKDALYNADGNVNLTGNNAVLGQAIPYAGEFGISKNPESFSSYAFRAYFSDKNRGAIIRLSMDGITNISDKGMSDFFADNLRVSRNIIGSYDDDKDIYNITLDRLTSDWNNQFNPSQDYQLNPDCNAIPPQVNVPTTISFKESVDGWTSRKDFVPESGLSLNNRYYTFKEGRVYEHGINIAANNFYRVQYDSSFNVIVNEMPNNVKGFSTVNYTGTQSRRFEYLVGAKWYSIAEINFNTTIPTAVRQKQPGWYVNYIKTDLEGGEVKEFEKKEGKWFNYIKALEIFNDCEITGDGIGNPDEVDSDPQEYILTITIDEECSGSGSDMTPDTIQFFVNIWDNIKTDPILDLNIINQPTALDAKCAIEAHYNLLNQSYFGYGGVINDGAAFSYIFNEGLQIGTQMYNSLTNEPIASSGTYLYVGPGENISEVTVNHAGLDANNATAVPSTYYIMILNSSGQIASWTQYNTLDTCQGDPDMGRRGVESVWSTYLVAGVTTANPYNFNFMLPFNTSTNQSTVCNLIEYLTFWFNLDSEDRGPYGVGSRDFFWYGPNNFEVGTQLYVFDNIAQEYVPFQPAFNSRALFKGTGGLSLPGVYNGQLMDPPTAPDEWYWVEISTLGVITSIDLYNTYSVAPCLP